MPELETSEDSGGASGELLRREIAAGRAATQESELASAPLSIVRAARTVAPAPGEAGSRLAWVALTIAGVLRLLFVCLGHTVVQAGATRIRAVVSMAVLVAALVVSAVMRSAA